IDERRFFWGLAANPEMASSIHDRDVLGTADYLAPEQALDSHQVDARADIYALGCIFVYLLSGKPPFPSGTLPQRLMAHQKEAPPEVSGAPRETIAIYQRMLAKRREDRYPSALAVGEVISDWLEGQ